MCPLQHRDCQEQLQASEGNITLPPETPAAAVLASQIASFRLRTHRLCSQEVLMAALNHTQHTCEKPQHQKEPRNTWSQQQ